MSCNNDKNLNEKFKDEYALAKHYANHVNRDPNRKDYGDVSRFEYMSPEKYERISETLVNSEAGSVNSDSNIIGYVDIDGNYRKFDRKARQLVIYDPETLIVKTFYKVREDVFRKRLKDTFLDELPENRETDVKEAIKELNNLEE